MGYGLSKRLHEAGTAVGLYRPVDIAKKANLNAVTVAAYLRGTRKASLEACFQLGEALKVDPFWLFKADEDIQEPPPEEKETPAVHQSKSTQKQIPLYSCALAGQDGSIAFSPDIIEYIAPPISNLSDQTYAVMVAGDSMDPRYEAGETVYVDPKKPIKKDSYVVAQINTDGEIMGYIKRFISISDDTLVLEQYNPAKKIKFPRLRVVSVHRVVFSG